MTYYIYNLYYKNKTFLFKNFNTYTHYANLHLFVFMHVMYVLNSKLPSTIECGKLKCLYFTIMSERCATYNILLGCVLQCLDDIKFVPFA